MLNDLIKTLLPGADVDGTLSSIRDKVLDMRVADVLLLLSMLQSNRKGQSTEANGDEEPKGYVAQN